MDLADTEAPPVASFSINRFGARVIHLIKFCFYVYYLCMIPLYTYKIYGRKLMTKLTLKLYKCMNLAVYPNLLMLKLSVDLVISKATLKLCQIFGISLLAARVRTVVRFLAYDGKINTEFRSNKI